MPLLQKVPGLERAVAQLKVGEQPAAVASAVEFVLEGLHLNKRLNKDKAVRPRPLPRLDMHKYRYSEWDGTQDSRPSTPIASSTAITDDLMNFGDLQHALRNLLQTRSPEPAGAALRRPARPAAAAAPASSPDPRPLRPDVGHRGHPAAPGRDPAHREEHAAPPPGGGRSSLSEHADEQPTESRDAEAQAPTRSRSGSSRRCSRASSSASRST